MRVKKTMSRVCVVRSSPVVVDIELIKDGQPTAMPNTKFECIAKGLEPNYKLTDLLRSILNDFNESTESVKYNFLKFTGSITDLISYLEKRVKESSGAFDCRIKFQNSQECIWFEEHYGIAKNASIPKKGYSEFGRAIKQVIAK